MGFDDSRVPVRRTQFAHAQRNLHGLDCYTHALRREPGGSFGASHRGLQVRSAFQPIFSYAHRRPVGYEGLLRAQDAAGNPVSPMTLLDAIDDFEETVFVDRLLRALHVANFRAAEPHAAWLFLNINPLVVIHGRRRGPFFRELLAEFGLPPQQVVVEVTESGTMEEEDLARAAAWFRDIGCLVAIDDFGAGHSNFNRIWKLQPDIIKLDREMIRKAASDPTAGRSLARIVSLLHEIGALVVAEGIETAEEALAAVNADADLLQGYWFARPQIGIGDIRDCDQRFAALRGEFSGRMRGEDVAFKSALQPYRAAFAHVSELVCAGAGLETAARVMIAMPKVQRFFLLDQNGTQIGANVPAAGGVEPPALRHGPLADASGANWMHRPYFRRAVTNPGSIQVTRPYLSIADARLCLTLSIDLDAGGSRRVLCCDIEYPLPQER